MEIGLDPNNSVIKRLRCTWKTVEDSDDSTGGTRDIVGSEMEEAI